ITAAADRGAALTAAPDLFAQVHAAWIWSGEDEGVERFAVERASSLLWEAYRVPGWDAMRRILVPLGPLVDRLATRIQADPTRVAYRGPTAQILAFVADVEPRRDGEKEIVERALRVCPSPRTARSPRATRLCESAARLAGPAGRKPTAAELTQAEADLG